MVSWLREGDDEKGVTLGVRSRYKMTWRGIGSSSWSSTHSLPLQMLITKYLLLATCFLTQLAVLAAPIPLNSDPSPPSDNALSARMLQPAAPEPPPIQKTKACQHCHDKKLGCNYNRPCQRCINTRDCVDFGVSLSLWRPLFSI